jgi:hypothetical protein
MPGGMPGDGSRDPYWLWLLATARSRSQHVARTHHVLLVFASKEFSEMWSPSVRKQRDMQKKHVRAGLVKRAKPQMACRAPRAHFKSYLQGSSENCIYTRRRQALTISFIP